MALTLIEKKAVVSEVSEIAKKSCSIVAADNFGLSVKDLTLLRQKARNANVAIKVVPNTLSIKALQNTEHSCLANSLVGPTILAFSTEAPSVATRILRDFVKNNEKIKVKAISLAGKSYDVNYIDLIASLPTKEEALAKLLMVMKEPIAKLARTLAEPTAKFARTLSSVRDKISN